MGIKEICLDFITKRAEKFGHKLPDFLAKNGLERLEDATEEQLKWFVWNTTYIHSVVVADNQRYAIDNGPAPKRTRMKQTDEERAKAQRRWHKMYNQGRRERDAQRKRDKRAAAKAARLAKEVPIV